MPQVVASGRFDSPNWLFEVKYDGFRAVAYAHAGKAVLVSRKANVYKSFGALYRELAAVISSDTILDGEIVCLDDCGKPAFYDLFRPWAGAYFFAFDCLWLKGRDLRELRLSNASGF